MLPISENILQGRPKTIKTALLIGLFVTIALAGLFYVKWWPYYHKAFTAASSHSIGSSILSNAVPSWEAAAGYAAAYFKSVWKAAVLGILLGSLVQVLLPVQWLYRVLGQASFKSTFIGGAAAIPAMMCSCCAAPIASGLRKRNVSIGASLAFWLGNPVLNPATLIFMTFVLSWKFTLIRLAFGLILTFGISYFANRFATQTSIPESMTEAASLPEPEGALWVRWLRSLGTMLISVVPAYLISVLLLGALQTWLFPVEMGSGFWAIVIFAIAGALFVIPTAAEIPILQSFLSLGLGSGPAAALLLTLPALSLPSLLMVAKTFPRKVLAFVLISVIAIGILSGLTGILVL
ncbi:permease [Paenibacillus sp. sptzw28]|uniref:permease n=1 Tax=Paenibacillus sp. sptzw28 TaxID=715179 RepID=UPI001C6E4D08|nr:permease [Paenibacillus sp. sptzw28]QYR23920.1 permease [Paenibacillus sp. sptzw28]